MREIVDVPVWLVFYRRVVAGGLVYWDAGVWSGRLATVRVGSLAERLCSRLVVLKDRQRDALVLLVIGRSVQRETAQSRGVEGRGGGRAEDGRGRGREAGVGRRRRQAGILGLIVFRHRLFEEVAVVLEEICLESGRAQRVVPLAVKQGSHCRKGRGYSLQNAVTALISFVFFLLLLQQSARGGGEGE